jgi:hypothetical protein
VKSSKAQIYAKFHKIPEINFEQRQQLTSFAGILIFQMLFKRLGLKNKLKNCLMSLLFPEACLSWMTEVWITSVDYPDPL